MGKYADVKIDAWEVFLKHMRKKGFLIEPFKDNQDLLTEEGKAYLNDCLRKIDNKEEN